MDYSYKKLASLGYSVEFRDWSREGRADRYLIARKPGVLAPTEEVLLVAHVDGVKRDAKERSPAADDNASGAVDLLQMRRVFSTFSFRLARESEGDDSYRCQSGCCSSG
jgi:hypothetical protein